MRGFIRVVCCAVLIGTLVPTGAFAAPKSEVRALHRDRIAAAKAAGRINPAGISLAAYVDAFEPDDEGPGQRVGGSTGLSLPLAQSRALQPSGSDDEDVDNYTLSGAVGTMYTFETTGTLDTAITLYNEATGEVLAWNDDKSEADVSSRLTWTATSGVKTVVCEISGWGKDGAYGMKISAASSTVRAASLSRIWGKNRMAGAVATAKAIYGPTYKKSDGSPVTDVIVVCGEDKSIVDSLSAASLAGWWEAPLLMTYSARLPVETSNAIKAIRAGNGGKVNIHVLGGTAVVPAAIYSKLSGLKGSRGKIERIAGKNRYALAEKVAYRLASLNVNDPNAGFDVFVANGENPKAFFDALAASGYCYSLNAPLLLTRNTSVPTETKRALQSTAYSDAFVNPVNGTKYMPASVLNGIYAFDEDRLVTPTGTDRYLAAIDIAQWGFYTFAATQDQVVIVNKLADALAAGTYTGATGGVMLYTPVAGPTSVTATFLSDRKSTIRDADIFGGEVCISAAGYKKVGTILNSK